MPRTEPKEVVAQYVQRNVLGFVARLADALGLPEHSGITIEPVTHLLTRIKIDLPGRGKRSFLVRVMEEQVIQTDTVRIPIPEEGQ